MPLANAEPLNFIVYRPFSNNPDATVVTILPMESNTCKETSAVLGTLNVIDVEGLNGLG